MRLLIVSDLHANLAALERVADDADEVVFLGDAVDYGADPAPAVDWVRRRAQHAVRGNHDHAVAFDEPTGASPSLAGAAEATAAWSRNVLSAEDRRFLGALPLTSRFEFAGARFLALHAAPSDPLYTYLPPETSESTWRTEIRDVHEDVLLYGHTHLPLLRRFGNVTVINPGSVGQPRDGIPMLSYAIWDDGDVLFARRTYDVEQSAQSLRRVEIDAAGRAQLASVLRTGLRSVPVPSR